MSKPEPAESPRVRSRLKLKAESFHELVRPARLKRYSNRQRQTNLPMQAYLNLLKLAKQESSSLLLQVHSFKPTKLKRYSKRLSRSKRPIKIHRLDRPERYFLHESPSTNSLPAERTCNLCFELVGRSNLAGKVVVGVVKTTTALVAKLEAENKTQTCKIFYIFIISSVQLKSLGKTNLLVLRREFTSSLFCLTCTNNGLLTSNSRLTIKLDNLTSKEQIRTYLYLFVRTTDRIGTRIIHGRADGLTFKLDSNPERNLTPPSTYLPDASHHARPERNLIGERRRIRIIHGRADIILLTLSLVEAYKESRQKRLIVKHRKYNFKTTILHCFSIDTAANNVRIYYICLLYTSPSPRDRQKSRMPSSA